MREANLKGLRDHSAASRPILASVAALCVAAIAFAPGVASAQSITILSSMTTGSATGDQMTKTIAAFEAASGIDVEVEQTRIGRVCRGRDDHGVVLAGARQRPREAAEFDRLDLDLDGRTEILVHVARDGRKRPLPELSRRLGNAVRLCRIADKPLEDVVGSFDGAGRARHGVRP